MKRASQLFVLEERDTGSPHVEKLWRTQSAPDTAFISVAVPRWEMVVTRQRGRTTLTIRGPETFASSVPIPPDAEFVGIQFQLGSFMPTLAMERLVDGAIELPAAGDDRFWLNGAAWRYPRLEDADVFVRRLESEELLVRDPGVEAALAGHPPALSRRTIERRVRRATGLSRGGIRQIARAQEAAALLDRGVPPLQVVTRLGYSDQPYLTRSLRRFVGQTPSEMAVAFVQDRPAELR